MKVMNKNTREIVEAIKNEDGTYTVNGKVMTAQEMSANYGKAPEDKEQSSSNTVDKIDMTATEVEIGGENIPALFKALSDMQGQIELGVKDKSGYGYNYQDLAAALSLAKKPLADNGLSCMQCPTTYIIGEVIIVRVTTILAHKDGGYIKNICEVPVKENNKKQALIHTLMGLVTYLNRYSRTAMLGMASEDKDAN